MICTGIAYEWLLEPPHPDGHDFTLIVAASRTALGSTNQMDLRHHIYHAKFPPAGQPFQLTDVSGTLGLLWQTTDQIAQQKAETFERMLADALMWNIGDLEFPPTDEHVVLIQGPLIPKLRGRYLYRGIDPRIPIYSVTFHMEWFRRIEAAQTAIAKLPRSHQPQVGNVYPPKAVDRATRAWVCRLPRDQEPAEPLHFEVIANMWDCCDRGTGGDWLDERKSEIEALTKTANLEAISEHNDTRLPRALALATREAKQWRTFEEQFSKVFRMGEELLTVAAAADRREELRILPKIFGDGFNANAVEFDEHDELSAATSESPQLDCEASYQHLRSNWQASDVRKAVDQFITRKAKRRRS
jgi:hypothetical protein